MDQRVSKSPRSLTLNSKSFTVHLLVYNSDWSMHLLVVSSWRDFVIISSVYVNLPLPKLQDNCSIFPNTKSDASWRDETFSHSNKGFFKLWIYSLINILIVERIWYIWHIKLLSFKLQFLLFYGYGNHSIVQNWVFTFQGKPIIFPQLKLGRGFSFLMKFIQVYLISLLRWVWS